MDAQEHYHEAERLLGQHRPVHERTGPPGDDSIAGAQVHATSPWPRSPRRPTDHRLTSHLGAI